MAIQNENIRKGPSTEGEYSSYHVMDHTHTSHKTPTETWEALRETPSSVLIDVRADAELYFAGKPDLSTIGKEILHIPWVTFPDGLKNSIFIKKLREKVPKNYTAAYFICRPEVCSQCAAALASKEGYLFTYSISLYGWKVTGLPWLQNQKLQK